MSDESPNRRVAAADARPALGPLVNHIGYALRRAQLAVFSDFIAVLGQVDLRPGQFSVLTLIGENPGIVQRQVCETLDIKPANFVPLYAELERRRLTKRVAIDGRSRGLYLTAKGRTLTARAQALSERHQERLIEEIGETECRHLIELLFRIADLSASSAADVGPVTIDA